MTVNWAIGMAGLVVTGWTGYNLVRALTGCRSGFAVLAGWMVGAGLLSWSVCWLYLAGGTLSGWLPWIQLALLGGSLAFLYVRRNVYSPETERFSHFPVAWAMRLGLAIVTVSVLLQAITTPALRFDEIHNWGFKALSTAMHDRPFEGYWPFMLFPNNIPFMAAGITSYMGQPYETLTHMIPFLFFAGLLAAFRFSAVRLSGRACWGLPLTCILVVWMPELLAQGDQLTCDLPLAALLMAAVAFSILWMQKGGVGTLLLSGFCAGLCAWTKTEGLFLTMGVGGGLAFAMLLDRPSPASFFRSACLWAIAAGVAIVPWYLFLSLTGVGMESSGHLGSFHPERFGVIAAALWRYLRARYLLSAVAFPVFLVLGFKWADRKWMVFVVMVILSGLVHVFLPLMMVPDDAFGGWQEFMHNGMARYLLHFAPVMLVAVAALRARSGPSPVDRVFGLLVYGRTAGD